MTQNLKDILKFFGWFVASIFLAWYTSVFFGTLYIKFYSSFDYSNVSSFDVLFGIPTAYLFFIFLGIPIFAPRTSKWIYLLLCLPAVAFQIWMPFSHIYFPYIFAVLGYLLAMLVNKIIKKQFPTINK